MRLFFLLIVFGAGQAVAGLRADGEFVYDGYEIDKRIIESCLETAALRGNIHQLFDNMRPCIGQASSACMDANDLSGNGLYDRRTYLGCAGAETQFWHQKIGLAVQRLKVWADDRGGENPNAPDAPKNALLKLAKIWPEFIEAKCTWVAGAYFGGRQAGISTTLCEMRQYGLQALELEIEVISRCSGQRYARFDEICKNISDASE